MYIKQVIIENIRAIERFQMDFEEPAGWHVVIGDNGSGKSSLVRAIALGKYGTPSTQRTPNHITQETFAYIRDAPRKNIR